ncbi:MULTISPECIES: DUF7919 family protein [unclassified Nocardia]|uniref:DUF7919 family protein n=1 Tax=unclassified Nocardia TaxID=2637762 RepID=UPI0033A4CEFE
MFFEDLSEYTYDDEDSFIDIESGYKAAWFRPTYTRLNVGWLAAGHPYPTGTVPHKFVEKLHAVQRVQMMNYCLGLHACDLCPAAEAPEHSGEVRIPGAPGTAYAAPSMIRHYITTHAYRPPQSFIDAVLAIDLTTWPTARWPDLPFPWIPDNAERQLD